MPTTTHLITAIGTPLDLDEELHVEGLECHLNDQWTAGINGILVGGSMGLMQMLSDSAYAALVAKAAKLSQGEGEVMVGIGDAGWRRTRDRMNYACQHPIDGVVVLPPYFFRFSQPQMIDYFRSLADESRVPVYLYDLPVRTGVSLDINTYEMLMKHPNIRGAKISGRIDIARELIARFGDRFRVIVAEPQMIGELLRAAIPNHLDGIFAAAPHWVASLARAATTEDWSQVDGYQERINALLSIVATAPSLFGALTAIMNARGIPGNFAAAPFPQLDDQQKQLLISNPTIVSLLNS